MTCTEGCGTSCITASGSNAGAGCSLTDLGTIGTGPWGCAAGIAGVAVGCSIGCGPEGGTVETAVTCCVTCGGEICGRTTGAGLNLTELTVIAGR